MAATIEDVRNDKTELRHYIVDNIDRAIDEGWIKAYYQPIIRGSNGRVCNEEALARWIDPNLGMLYPDEFISILEAEGLIYKLDLFMIDEVINAFKTAEAAGLYLVPNSINLSREDFDHCDMVEELRSRVDAAGLDRSLFNVEITETVIGRDFRFMKTQVDRFRELGFSVWMDDFGAGYSSLDFLQRLDFDVVKMDMNFMREFDTNSKTRIILTELIKMATSLGIETVTEGVETEDQVDFLREIGCTKLQGYYYCKPVPLEDILERSSNGTYIGYENPDETSYYETIGKISLYDLDDVSNEEISDLKKFFDALPVAILEHNGDRLTLARCNKSYKEFLSTCFGITDTSRSYNHTAVMRGSKAGIFSLFEKCRGHRRRMLFEECINGRYDISGFVRHSADNKVTGAAAYTMVILSIRSRTDSSNITYADVAKALASDYVFLYHVDLSTNDFVEYTPDAAHGNLSVERHGHDFFNQSQRDALEKIYPEDQKGFLTSFRRENIMKAIDSVGTFTLSYRLMMEDAPVYVSMKAVRMDSNHIVIGVSNVDAYMRHIEALERVKEESITYSRISALSGEYIAIYTVDPATGDFHEYSATAEFAKLGLQKDGGDFFGLMRTLSPLVVHPDDLEGYMMVCKEENIMHDIAQSGLFEYSYRLVLNGEPVHVSLKAARIEEKDGPRIIVGISNIDETVKRHQEYEASLTEARNLVNIDGLTGVKNKHSYLDFEDRLNQEIADGADPEFAITVLDLNGLKDINDAHGHQTGDNYIKAGCRFICGVFDHSPVFRVGGDEFAVISRGHDYEHLDELLEEVHAHNDLCLKRRREAAELLGADEGRGELSEADAIRLASQMTVEAGKHDRGEKVNRDYSKAKVGQIYEFDPAEVMIACGAARYEADPSVAAVFDRADLAMYLNKKDLKESR